jgi:hypothetical protein
LMSRWCAHSFGGLLQRVQPIASLPQARGVT